MAKDNDAGQMNLDLDPIEQIKGKMLQVHADGSGSNLEAPQDSDEGSSLHSSAAPDEQKKIARNERARIRRAAKKQGVAPPPISRSKSSITSNGSPNIGTPGIIQRVSGIPSVTPSDQMDTEMNAVVTAPQQGVGAIGQASSGLGVLNKIAGSHRDYNNASGGPFVQDASKAAESVAKQNKEAAKTTPGSITALNPTGMNSGAAGAGSTTGAGGTRPWWMKMQDTLEDINSDIKRILDIVGHSKGAHEGAIAKNGSAKDEKGGDLLSALAPLMIALGAMLAEKFGGMAAQLLNASAKAAESAVKAIESKLSGLGNSTKNLATSTIDNAKNAGKSIADNIHGVTEAVIEDAGKGASKASEIGKSILGAAGGLGKKLASVANTKAGGLVAGSLKNAYRGALIVGGIETVDHINKSVKKFKAGDKIGGSVEVLRSAATIMEYGGPKDAIGAIPFVGKGLSKGIPEVIKPLAQNIARSGFKLAKRAAVSFGIGAAQAGAEGFVNPLADIAGIGIGIAGTLAGAKGLNYAADRMEEKGGRDFLHKAGGALNIAGSIMTTGGVAAAMGNKDSANILQAIANKFGAKSSEPKTESVARTAPRAAAAAGVGKPSMNQNINNNHTTNINIGKVDASTPDAAKKNLAEALKAKAIQDAAVKKSQEQYSNNGMNSFFNSMGAGLASIAAIL